MTSTTKREDPIQKISRELLEKWLKIDLKTEYPLLSKFINSMTTENVAIRCVALSKWFSTHPNLMPNYVSGLFVGQQDLVDDETPSMKHYPHSAQFEQLLKVVLRQGGTFISKEVLNHMEYGYIMSAGAVLLKTR